MPTGARLIQICAVVSFGPFLSQLDTTLVNVALSTLSEDLNAPLDVIQWVATGYLLALALMIPLTAWLVDRVGAKRVYIICFGMFTLASAMCGLATSAHTLIGFRIVQGMAGGLLAPMSQMMIARYSGANMAKMISLVTVPVMAAPIFGPSVAGFILHFASWHWLFFLNLPICIAAILLSMILLPADDDRKERRLDVTGFLLVSPGLVLLLDGLKRVTTTDGSLIAHIAEVAAAVLLLTAFAIRGLRMGAAGLIDLRLFKGGTFVASSITQFFANAMQQAGQMIFPLFLLVGLGFEPAVVGLMLAPMGFGSLLARPFGDRLIRTFGPRRVSMGSAALGLVATLPFVWPGVTMPSLLIVVALFIRSMGQGMINVPSVVSAYASVPRSSLADAATALNIVQRLGGPMATMSLALLLQYLSGTDPASSAGLGLVTMGAFHAGFALMCLYGLFCILAASRLPDVVESRR